MNLGKEESINSAMNLSNLGDRLMDAGGDAGTWVMAAHAAAHARRCTRSTERRERNDSFAGQRETRERRRRDGDDGARELEVARTADVEAGGAGAVLRGRQGSQGFERC